MINRVLGGGGMVIMKISEDCYERECYNLKCDMKTFL